MMQLLMLILFTSLSMATNDRLYTSISVQERMGNEYRHEIVSRWPNCIEHKLAEKTYLHKTNELREIAIWDPNGKVRGAAGHNATPALMAESNGIFAKSTLSSNPCHKPPVPEVKPVPEKVPEPEPDPEKPLFPPGYLQ
jgi:hypothetical protein